MEVRELAVKDAMALARMFGKLKFEPKPEEQSLMEYGQGILLMALDRCGDEALAWLGSMVGMTKEQFEEEPAGCIVEVVEAIMAQEGARDFFGKVWGLVSKSSKTATTGPTTPSETSASDAI